MTSSLLNPIVDGDSVRFDRAECVELGKKYHDQYCSADPYPSIVLDNFLPMDLLKRILTEFPPRATPKFADGHSQLKVGYQLDAIKSNFITNLCYALNSWQFLGFVEELTGRGPLLGDPEYAGGGLHETARGGHLSIHADYNIHKRFKLHRRLNLILFLNENWQESYGGCLELWDREMKACAKQILPTIGKAVIFNTDDDTYHGHPDPLTCPENVFRRSLALYYFTVPEHSMERKTTVFQVRPGSNDEKPKTDLFKTFVDNWCPPILKKKSKK